MPHSSTAMEACIQACTSCHHICLETVTHCLERGGDHAAPAHIGLLLDCAQICQTSADFMLRGSSLHATTCGACATVCDACAASCEQFAGDPEMERCAQACRQCAESCRQMATMAA